MTFATCKMVAKKRKAPFQRVHLLKGAPAGCVKDNSGRIFFVEDCKNDDVCGTTKCDESRSRMGKGCQVITEQN